MKSQRLLGEDFTGKKSYATVERAVAEAEKTLASVHWDDGIMRYTIGACVSKTGAVRYYPIFLPSDSQIQLAIYIAHNPGHAFNRM